MAEIPFTEAEARDVLGLFTGPMFYATNTHNPKNGVTAGVWTVSAGEKHAVLKVLTRRKETEAHWAASEDPRHWNYWRREAHVYESGLAQVWRPYGIRAPRLLACVERADGDVALWLERLRGRPATRWRVQSHAEHARRLGVAQGAVGETPDQPWVSRGFLREYVGSKTLGQELLDDDEAWQQPLIRDHFSPGLRKDMVRLHHDREWFLYIMETLPRALNHLDHWPANLRTTGRNSALFDWSFTGDGALGEDIGNYIPDTFFDLFLPASRLPELASAVYEAYVEGLREGGWRGDERLVRLGVCASVVKYDWITGLMLARASEEQHVGYGGAHAVSPEHLYRERGLVLAFLAGWAAEARELASAVGFSGAPSGR